MRYKVSKFEGFWFCEPIDDDSASYDQFITWAGAFNCARILSGLGESKQFLGQPSRKKLK
jgi:hypothetical protein